MDEGKAASKPTTSSQLHCIRLARVSLEHIRCSKVAAARLVAADVRAQLSDRTTRAEPRTEPVHEHRARELKPRARFRAEVPNEDRQQELHNERDHDKRDVHDLVQVLTRVVEKPFVRLVFVTCRRPNERKHSELDERHEDH